jgi:hypothetical protein
VLRHIGSHGAVGKLDAFLVVLIDSCGASQLLADIPHELTEMHGAFPCAGDCYILRSLCGGKGHHLLLLRNLSDITAIDFPTSPDFDRMTPGAPSPPLGLPYVALLLQICIEEHRLNVSRVHVHVPCGGNRKDATQCAEFDDRSKGIKILYSCPMAKTLSN